MVVEQRLRHVQEALARNPEFGEGVVERLEVVESRFVRLHVLGGDDLVELDAEARVATGEAVAMDIGHDDQGVVLGQCREGLGVTTCELDGGGHGRQSLVLRDNAVKKQVRSDRAARSCSSGTGWRPEKSD